VGLETPIQSFETVTEIDACNIGEQRKKRNLLLHCKSCAQKEHFLIVQIETLRELIIKAKLQHTLHIDAVVVLPDRLHTVWSLPNDDADYSKWWILIKSGFSRCIPKKEHRHKRPINKGGRRIW
jgi:REP element-mobilizing transposase RayT